MLARIAAVWPIFALMQPLNGAVFALDGILIGAGDSSYIMWSMVGVGRRLRADRRRLARPALGPRWRLARDPRADRRAPGADGPPLPAPRLAHRRRLTQSAPNTVAPRQPRPSTPFGQACKGLPRRQTRVTEVRQPSPQGSRSRMNTGPSVSFGRGLPGHVPSSNKGVQECDKASTGIRRRVRPARERRGGRGARPRRPSGAAASAPSRRPRCRARSRGRRGRRSRRRLRPGTLRRLP